MNGERFDVVVIGGGPSGSTVASFVAMKGHRVMLLEREQFPRHQVGESLLPATVNGICAMLGLKEELARANFTFKKGGTYRWGSHPEPWSFTFGPSTADPGSQAFAYQVERARFDHLLLRNAACKGVEVCEQCGVKEVLRKDGRVCGVCYVDGSGQEHTVEATYVVDAAGNTTSFSKIAGERVYSKFFQNVALYCYFDSAKRLPEPNRGNILCEAFNEGWFWFIPLSDQLTSVGAVVGKEHAGVIGQDPDLAMKRFVSGTRIISEFLRPATRITDGMYGRYRIRKDYSYTTERFWTPGFSLVGDAACFIDPVFSSGVHLATYSALLAARAINSALAGEVAEDRAFTEYEARYRREFMRFYDFLVAFYDMDKDVDSYFWEARRVLNTEERANDAFVRLVAGTSETGEPLFRTATEFFDVRKGSGEAFRRAYEGAAGPEADDFFREMRQGIVEVMNQGTQRTRPQEQPLFPGGLIASSDGLSWMEPLREPATV